MPIRLIRTRLLTPRRSQVAAAAVLLLANASASATGLSEEEITFETASASAPVTLEQLGRHSEENRPQAARVAQLSAEGVLPTGETPMKRPTGAQEEETAGTAPAPEPVTLEQLRKHLKLNRPGAARSHQQSADGSLPTQQVPMKRPGQAQEDDVPEPQEEETAGASVAAAPVTLERLAAYMNEYRQGWAEFTQLNADGSTSTGVIIMKRPTRARIEYGLPNAGLIVANERRVAVFDLKSNSAPVVWALSRTPLYFLLQENIDIAAPEVLVDYRIGAASSEVAVRSPDKRFKGSVMLNFQHNPIRLAGWVYTDEFGQKTRVIFGAMGSEIAIDDEMFDIDAEVRRLESQM